MNRIHLNLVLAPLYSKLAMPEADLSSKLAIVTGANSGVGFEAAHALAQMGAHVILACRNRSRAEDAKKRIIESTGNFRVEVEILDCASFTSVRAFLSRWEERESRQVDILINNAGVFIIADLPPDLMLTDHSNL
ncbi:hypothetical protein RSOLAG1IB_07784 [Rhizoctonia solani AG-1 IB]|uniref:WW domain-containing oxidoreductase n=1 Tax=Thanatephorus cucumeris (strain AG1-IB / isolate 7/3/14) TaxID=1108050 RepID=A0A0B7FJI2_THACB|nr:hypothetical protein RSOLAG1IB_07784 [Rhizoctonia solani AG-1 IB]